MPAYLIADVVRIKDEAKMAEYRSRVVQVVERFGGKYLATGGRFETMEGKWHPTFPVIIRFPNLERAYAWYNSDEYKPLKSLRQSASEVDIIFLDGVAEE